MMRRIVEFPLLSVDIERCGLFNSTRDKIREGHSLPNGTSNEFLADLPFSNASDRLPGWLRFSLADFCATAICKTGKLLPES